MAHLSYYSPLTKMKLLGNSGLILMLYFSKWAYVFLNFKWNLNAKWKFCPDNLLASLSPGAWWLYRCCHCRLSIYSKGCGEEQHEIINGLIISKAEALYYRNAWRLLLPISCVKDELYLPLNRTCELCPYAVQWRDHVDKLCKGSSSVSFQVFNLS